MNELAYILPVTVAEEINELSIPEMLHLAKSLIVDNESAFSQITKLYKTAKSWEKEIERQRKDANAPEQSRINERNDKAKKAVAPLLEIQTACKQRLDAYTKLLEARKEAEQAKRLEAATILEMPLPEYQAINPTLRGEGALVYTAYERRFEIENMATVPNEYWVVDEDKIKKHIALGVEEIPGVRIWVEKVTKVKTR